MSALTWKYIVLLVCRHHILPSIDWTSKDTIEIQSEYELKIPVFKAGAPGYTKVFVYYLN
jgi:hypothetical protein